jgi:soluble lytic murein transglycosylase-like protein
VQKLEKERSRLLGELTIQQIKEKSPLFLRRAELTKKRARHNGVDQLTPEFVKILDQKLQTLFWKQKNFLLSTKEFDKLCTKKRIEAVREMFLELSGEEFNRRLKKYKFSNIWHGLRFPDYSKEGFWREDSKFFNEKCVPLIEAAAPIAAKKYGLPNLRALTELVKKTLWHESRGDPFAVSTTEHLGIGQLGKVLFNGADSRYRKKVNPFNITEAIPRAVDYVARNFEAFSQNEQLALLAYNAGPGAVHRRNKKPLSSEAQKYPAAVQKSYKRFKLLASRG